MPLEKVSSASVRTVDGETILISRRDGNVVFDHAEGGTLTFTAEDLREIVAEFAPKPRQSRGPRKPKAAPAPAGNGTHAAAAA